MRQNKLEKIKELQREIDNLVETKRAINNTIESLQAELTSLADSPIIFLEFVKPEIVKVEETEILEFRKAA